MATQTLSAADAILKDLYVGPIVEQLNNKTYMLDQVERDSDHIDHTGRRAVVPLHASRNRGRGSRGAGGQLPVAGRQGWVDAIVAIRYHYYAIEIEDAAVEATQSNEGAFVKLLEAESKGVAQDAKKDLNRQVFGTGDGVLTAVGTGGAAMGATTLPVASTQYLGIGDPVEVRTISNGTLKSAASTTITDIQDGAGPPQTITISPGLAAAATAATDAVYVEGDRNTEMDGLRNIVSTSRTLHGIDSSQAANRFFNAKDFDAASATAGESLFEQLADAVGATGQGEVEVFLTTRGIKRRLADTYQSQKRYNDAKAVDVHGGYSAVMVNEVPVIADDEAPKGFAFGLDKSAFKWFQQAGPGWLESKDGQVFHLKDSSTAGRKDAVWQAWFKWYAAFGCVAPNRTGRIRNAADDTPAYADKG